jgi:Kdo2-lipid IVA lauroyltransferase/acyltransferase
VTRKWILSKPLGSHFASAVFWLMGAVPLGALHVVGRFFGYLMWVLPGSFKDRALKNIRLVVPANQAVTGVKASLVHVATLFLEMPYWWSAKHVEQRMADQIRDHDWSEIDQVLSLGRGVILISPHIGNFELLGPVFSQRHRATVLFRIPSIAWLRDWLLDLRNRGNLRLVPADVKGVRALAKALKRGEAVGILPDQVPIAGEGVWAPFFGQPAYTTTLVQRLQKLTGAPVVVLCAYRDAHAAGFSLRHWVLQGDWPEDPVASATRLNQALEVAIRHAPEQYLWGYDRFRKPKTRRAKSALPEA